MGKECFLNRKVFSLVGFKPQSVTGPYSMVKRFKKLTIYIYSKLQEIEFRARREVVIYIFGVAIMPTVIVLYIPKIYLILKRIIYQSYIPKAKAKLTRG